MLSKVECLVAKWLARRITYSDGQHQAKTEAVLTIFIEESSKAFNEDNASTTQAYWLDRVAGGVAQSSIAPQVFRKSWIRSNGSWEFDESYPQLS